MRFAYDIFDNSDKQDYAQFGNVAQDIDTGIKVNNITNQGKTIGTGISSFGNLKRTEGELAAQVNAAKSQARQQANNAIMGSIFSIGSSAIGAFGKGGGLGKPDSFDGVDTSFNSENFYKFDPKTFESTFNLGSWY
tara:strand:+ start:229 stop:636 length:408 start_codon:yes stop_codon:yes gene_type:complete